MTYQASRFKGAQLLELWIDHLALCAGDGLQSGETSQLLSADQSWRLRPVAAESAIEILTDYCALFRQGMGSPLPFLPETSYAWASAENRKQAQARSEKIWLNQRPGSDASDPYLQLALRNIQPNPIDNEAFVALAQRVYTSLLDHGEKL